MDFWGDALGLIILGDGRTRALLQYLSPLLHYSPPSLLHLSPATVCSSRAVSNGQNQHHCGLGSPLHLVVFSSIETSRTSLPNHDFALASI